MPIGDNSHLIESVSVGTGIPLFLPRGMVELLAPRPEQRVAAHGETCLGSSSSCSKLQPRWAFHPGIVRALETNKYFHLLFCLWALGLKSVLILLSSTWGRSWRWLNSSFLFPLRHFFFVLRVWSRRSWAATVCGQEPVELDSGASRGARQCVWRSPPGHLWPVPSLCSLQMGPMGPMGPWGGFGTGRRASSWAGLHFHYQ